MNCYILSICSLFGAAAEFRNVRFVLVAVKDTPAAAATLGPYELIDLPTDGARLISSGSGRR